MTRRAVVRASRFVTPSKQVDRGAELAPRRVIDYWCAADHHTSTPFAADAEPPGEWPCGVCDGPATTSRGTAPARSRPTVFPRTPYEFLMMRRRNLPRPERRSSVRSRLYLGVTAHSLTSGDRLVPVGPEAIEPTSRILIRSLLDRIREYLDALRRRAVRPGPTANPRTSTTNSSRSNDER